MGIPEAAFFARTYLPSEISRVVALWRVQLGKVNEKAGQSLADPGEYQNLFPDFQASLQAQQMLQKERGHVIPAADFSEIMPNHERNPLVELNAMGDEDVLDDDVDEKDHPVSPSPPHAEPEATTAETEDSGEGGEPSKPMSTEELEAIDTTDVNLDDEELLED